MRTLYELLLEAYSQKPTVPRVQPLYSFAAHGILSQCRQDMATLEIVLTNHLRHASRAGFANFSEAVIIYGDRLLSYICGIDINEKGEGKKEIKKKIFHRKFFFFNLQFLF